VLLQNGPQLLELPPQLVPRRGEAHRLLAKFRASRRPQRFGLVVVGAAAESWSWPLGAAEAARSIAPLRSSSSPSRVTARQRPQFASGAGQVFKTRVSREA